MPTFDYHALTPAGRLMKGTLEAASREEAGELLAEMQLAVQSLERASAPRPQTVIGRNEFMLFNQQLASLTRAGIPLARGLRELAADVTSRRMRNLIAAVAEDLESGSSLEQVFEKRQASFPPLYAHIVRAGVKSGRLGEMLSSLNRHLEMTAQTRRIVFEATCYPLVVLALAAAVLTWVFCTIVPQLSAIFDTMGIPMPGITAFLTMLTDHSLDFWIVVGCVVAAALLLGLVLSRSAGGRQLKESLFMAIPVLGRLYRRSALSRMADAMATLVGAGCDLPECFRLAASVAGSETLIADCEALAGRLEQGEELMEAGEGCRMIPRVFLYSAQLGAQRNELQDNLYGLSQMYADQARNDQARLQAILMPILVVFVGAVIGLIITAIFLPFTALLRSMQPW